MYYKRGKVPFWVIKTSGFYVLWGKAFIQEGVDRKHYIYYITLWSFALLKYTLAQKEDEGKGDQEDEPMSVETDEPAAPALREPRERTFEVGRQVAQELWFQLNLFQA